MIPIDEDSTHFMPLRRYLNDGLKRCNELTGSDRRVIDEIIDKTYGQNRKGAVSHKNRKDRNRISQAEISAETGLKIDQVKRSLTKLKRFGIVVEYRPAIRRLGIPSEIGICGYPSEWKIASLGAQNRTLNKASLGAQNRTLNCAKPHLKMCKTAPKEGKKPQSSAGSLIPIETLREIQRENTCVDGQIIQDPKPLDQDIPVYLKAIRHAEKTIVFTSTSSGQFKVRQWFELHGTKKAIRGLWMRATESTLKIRAERMKLPRNERYLKTCVLTHILDEASNIFAEDQSRKIAESQADDIKRKNQPYLYDHNGNLLDDQPPTTRKESK